MKILKEKLEYLVSRSKLPPCLHHPNLSYYVVILVTQTPTTCSLLTVSDLLRGEKKKKVI